VKKAQSHRFGTMACGPALRPNGRIVATFQPVSLDPPLVGVHPEVVDHLVEADCTQTAQKNANRRKNLEEIQRRSCRHDSAGP
jgi:hypothetical protein